MKTIVATGIVAITLGLTFLGTPVFASDVRDTIQDACQLGWQPMKETVPFEVEGGRETALELVDQSIGTFCSCITDAAPMTTLTPRKLDHLRYFLENVMSSKDQFETQYELRDLGLTTPELQVAQLEYSDWAVECISSMSR